jgi:hypothetical protein
MNMSKARFMAMAEAAGIDVLYSGGGRHPRTGEMIPYELTLDAPEGKQFVGSGCGCDCSLMGQEGETSPDWPRMRRALKEIIADGFEDLEPEELGPEVGP